MKRHSLKDKVKKEDIRSPTVFSVVADETSIFLCGQPNSICIIALLAKGPKLGIIYTDAESRTKASSEQGPQF